jgi:hypothetical protein
MRLVPSALIVALLAGTATTAPAQALPLERLLMNLQSGFGPGIVLVRHDDDDDGHRPIKRMKKNDDDDDGHRRGKRMKKNDDDDDGYRRGKRTQKDDDDDNGGRRGNDDDD